MSWQPGWYDDGKGAMRWWDGNAWTENVQPPLSASREPSPAEGESRREARAREASAVTSERQQESQIKIPTFGARKVAVQLAERVKELEEAARRYGHFDLTQLDAELNRRRDEIRAATADLLAVRAQIQSAQAELEAEQSAILDVRATAGIQELGLYDYEHPAETSTALAGRLQRIRSMTKMMISNKTAAEATSTFTFNNSEAKGRKFVSDMTKILLRAYNAEAENCIKTVRAGNLAVAQARLTKAAEMIQRQGSMINLRIAPEYHRLRLEEIAVANAHLAALQAEKELDRERRAELREQKKAEAELRAEQARLEKERGHYRATLETLIANGDTEGAARIQAQLDDVQRAIEDVDYRAANIRAGYVYVISNKGSFGNRVVKIGMTRRLEPMDRVRELGDASVPFRFDVHALFFAQDAVGVETMLHRRFAEQRVNRVNLRREFFYVTPEQVLEVLREHSVEILEFNLDIESEEYSISKSFAAEATAHREVEATA